MPAQRKPPQTVVPSRVTVSRSANPNHTQKRGAPFFRVLCGRVGGENARTTKTTPNCRPEPSNRFAKRKSKSHPKEGCPILPRSVRKGGRQECPHNESQP